MKKVLFAICMTAFLASCATSGKIRSISALTGEWNITEVEGKAVGAGNDGNAPFIGFDTKENRVYGSTGCNRLTGALNANVETGTIDFGALGSTRMMCADMKTEQAVLGALGKVSTFSMQKKGVLEFKDSTGKTVMTLKHK